MKIKVCGMKFKHNIQEVMVLKPDYLGFIFYENSERCMAKTLLPNDLEILAAKNVGVFVNAALEKVEEAIDQFDLDAIQLHGNESPEYCSHFKNSCVEIIKAFSIDNEFDFQITKDYKNDCDYFLFDTKGGKEGGNGISFNWQILKNYDQEIPFFLSGGIGPENISEAIKLKGLNIYGIDINSKVEDSPGLKNLEKVKETISIIRQLK